jgi:TonB-linked SusC/RagA family outer membrane protein
MKRRRRIGSFLARSVKTWPTKVLFLTFLLSIESVTLFAQGGKIRVTGQIKSSLENEPLPGASVKIKGTNEATLTDLNGKYSIEVDDTATLIVSFIGYNSETLPVSGRTQIDVVLVESMKMLNETVVIGYGTMKRTDLSSAQVSITSEELSRSTITSIDQAIQGRAAGVMVTQNSGAPGGAVSIYIRGVNSISGSTEPMYVIDGIQIMGDDRNNVLTGINPADIESMNILEGPAATSIYGSRAGNGVILITTKRGKAGETKIQYNGDFSMQMLPDFLPTMNLREYATYMNEYNKVTNQDSIPEYADPSVLGEGTNWQKELFQKAMMQKHQISVSGGNEKTTFYLSTEYLKQDGVAYGSGFNRYSMRLKVDNQTRKWLKIGSNIGLSQTNMDETFGESVTGADGNIIRTALAQSPAIAVKNPDGTYGGPTQTQYQLSNPIGLADINSNETVKRNIMGNFYIDIELLKGLKFSNSLNGNIGYSNNYQFHPSYTFGGYVFESSSSNSFRSATNDFYWNLVSTLTYDKTIGDHSLSLMLGHECQESQHFLLSGSRSGYLTDIIEELPSGDASSATNNSEKSSWAMESYFLRGNYNFHNRYFIMATVRRDGSTNFGENKRYGYFPSITASYKITEEPFLDFVKQIGDVKLRGEYGISGNQSAGSFAYLSKLKASETTWGTGYKIDNFSNSDLQWEETKSYNYGIDISLFNNRIEFIFDKYHKNIDNLLMQLPLAAYMGTTGQEQDGVIAAPWVNIGEMENKGFGITLRTVNIEKPFTWRSGITFSWDRNKLTKLYTNSSKIDLTSSSLGGFMQRAEVGQPLWQYYIYKHQGLFKSLNEIRGHAKQNTTGAIDKNTGTWVGDVKFEDYTPDGVIDENDRQYMGSPFPKFTGGFTNTFGYKNFELYVLVNYCYGNKIYNYVRYRNESLTSGPGWNHFKVAANFARVSTDANGEPYLENPGTNIQRITGDSDPNGNDRSSDFFLEDGSYIRVKNIQLSYTVPKSLFNKMHISNAIQGARFSFNVQNAFTFTKYKGYDPEVGKFYDSSTNYTFTGVDAGRYPQTRVYTLNVQLEF